MAWDRRQWSRIEANAERWRWSAGAWCPTRAIARQKSSTLLVPAMDSMPASSLPSCGRWVHRKRWRSPTMSALRPSPPLAIFKATHPGMTSDVDRLGPSESARGSIGLSAAQDKEDLDAHANDARPAADAHRGSLGRLHQRRNVRAGEPGHRPG